MEVKVYGNNSADSAQLGRECYERWAIHLLAIVCPIAQETGQRYGFQAMREILSKGLTLK